MVTRFSQGNELCGTGVSARIQAEQYGKDVVALKNLVEELYPDPDTRPQVLGPAGFYDEKWFNRFLQATGPNVVDGLTHHIYNLGAGQYNIFLCIVLISSEFEIMKDCTILDISPSIM